MKKVLIVLFFAVFQFVAFSQYTHNDNNDIYDQNGVDIIGNVDILWTFSDPQQDSWVSTRIIVEVYSKGSKTRTWYRTDYPNLTIEEAANAAGEDIDPWVTLAIQELYNGTGSSSGSSGGSLGGATDPVVSQNIQMFKNTIFSEKATPRATKEEKKEEEKKSSLLLKPNLARADISNEWFTINKADGNNFNLNGFYAKTFEDNILDFGGFVTLGGNLNINTISFEDGDDSFNNITFGANASKIITEDENIVRTGGLNFNFTSIDEDMSDDNGVTFAFSYSEKRYIDERIITYGGMYNISSIGDYTSTYFSLAGMYGQPIDEKFALNGDLIYTRNLTASYDGTDVTDGMDGRNMLNIGVSGDYFISQDFMLNAGFRKTLLIEDYSNFEITIGTKYCF